MNKRRRERYILKHGGLPKLSQEQKDVINKRDKVKYLALSTEVRRELAAKMNARKKQNMALLKINNPEEYARREGAWKAYRKEWLKNNRARVRKEQKKNYLRRKYQLTEEQYELKLASQDGACSICKRLPSEGLALHVDHSHSTGAIRDLLCGSCNRGIGIFKDSPSLLRAAAEYLEFHSLAKEVNL